MTFRYLPGLVLGLASLSAFAQPSGSTQPDLTAQSPANVSRAASASAVRAKDAFITALMKRMTVDEKIGQLRLVSVPAGRNVSREGFMSDIRAGRAGAVFNTVTRPDIRAMQVEAAEHSRLKIPLIFAYDVVHGHRTVFPISLGLAATWDLGAIARSARVAAIEASADGLDLTFSPMVDITRDPRWGRTSEGFGEDTYLTSRIAATIVHAYQQDDLTAADTVMASVKHFALYGAAEGGRDYNTVDMSPQRMFQDYLPPYKAGLDAGAGAVMIALNAVNGIPATANTWLLRDLLRRQWGFKGITVSDHGAIMELIRHGVARDGRDAARIAIKAGVDWSMNDSLYGQYLADLLRTGEISQADLDRACRDVLSAKYDLGLFKNPYNRLGSANDPVFDTDAEDRLHRADARQIARESIVLLKNANQTLPLKKQGTIAVIGPLAKSQRDVMGSWSAAGKARQAVSIYQGLADSVGQQAHLLYAKGANVTESPAIITYLNTYDQNVIVDPRTPRQMLAEAVKVASKADVIVAVVGESQGMADEASSRTRLDIPASQRALIAALKTTGKPLVLVLMNGRPLALEHENQQADAIIETWYGGTEGGHAAADVLFGDYNPSGKLPMTFPRSVGQVPIYYNHLNTGRPFDPDHPDKYTSRYFDSANGPLFPFGYGLSYTAFSLSGLTLSSDVMKQGRPLSASVTLTNTGPYDGATVVQLYIQDPVASISRPVKELKHFRRVVLKAGEQRTIDFPIREDDLKFFNNNLQWRAEPGDFKVYVGLDSNKVQERGFTLEP